MDRQSATNLINTTLASPFDERQFAIFTRELLNHLDTRKAFSASANYIKTGFRGHIRHYKRVGTYTDPTGMKMDVMVVYLQPGVSLDRARGIQRSFIVDYLKNRGGKNAGLAAFVADDPDDWRFSFVRIDYTTRPDESGRERIKVVLPPPRRYSFLVGVNEPNHTAQQQLYPILQNSQADPSLADIENAFNIESITREFFEQYHGLFEKLKNELVNILARDQKVRAEFERCQIDTGGFAKKLLGQIVFLYFLQKKGWLGVQSGRAWGSGPRNFLQELYQHRQEGVNFFNDLLEPLFYEALAVKRADDFYTPLNCHIPFLNGGLFEPTNGYDWQNTDVCISDDIFGEIFTTFNLYNFTVREDEPLEREVAVDPEMLGKVFENLLDVQDRKSKGAFYTPREIVHYMCQESLINYLDTRLNRREAPLTPVDPQQGQLFGAPPPVQSALSMEQYAPVVDRRNLEFFIRYGESAVAQDSAVEEGLVSSYRPMMPEEIRHNAAQLDSALADVLICDPAVGSGAFLVGMMTEIVKVRSVLSTYLPAGGRSAYAFKRHAIEHSLYGVDIDASAVDIARLRLWLSLVVDEDDFQTIQPLPNLDYKIVCGSSLQSVNQGYMAGEVEALKEQYQTATDRASKAQLRAQIDRILGTLTARFTRFDFRIYFSEVFRRQGGFDIVIANPPYVRAERITAIKNDLKSQFDCFTGTADLYVYFYERGLEILRDNGALTFISSNKYFRSAYGEKLRQHLVDYSLDQLIDFGDAPVFDAIAYPSIIIMRKTPATPGARVRVLAWKPGPAITEFSSVFEMNSFWLEQHELRPDGWRLESPRVMRLLEKITAAGRPLGEVVNGQIYYGIKTGYNEAFIIDGATRAALIAEHPSSAEIIKPILRGRDVKRWQTSFADLYLIKIESSENRRHSWSGLSDIAAERAFADAFPAVYRHLNQHREALINRGDQGRYFWELRSCKYWDEFEKPKIVYPNICQRNEFYFDRQGFLTNQKAFIITGVSEDLVAILNSNVIHWLFIQRLPKLQGDFFEPSAVFFQYFPIPPTVNPQILINIIRKIESAITFGLPIDELESQLNTEVYRLYGLDDEEIAIIEAAIAV